MSASFRPLFGRATIGASGLLRAAARQVIVDRDLAIDAEASRLAAAEAADIAAVEVQLRAAAALADATPAKPRRRRSVKAVSAS